MSSNIIFVKNLPTKLTNEELYDIFWKYGEIIQIRKGVSKEKRGSAYVVYNSIENAEKAHKELNGFNVLGKYIICQFFKK